MSGLSTNDNVFAGDNQSDRLPKERVAYVEKLRRQLWEKEEEAKRVRTEMVSWAGILEQKLAAQAQNIARVQNQLVSELRSHQEAMRASARQQARREEALTRSYRDQLRQVRTEHLRGQYHHPSTPSPHIDDDVSRLADRMAALHLAARCEESTFRLPIRLRRPSALTGRMADDRDPVPATPTSISANKRLRQIITDQRSSNERLSEELANQKAAADTLRKALADCNAKANQPPVDHCAARLRDLQTRLDQEHERKLDEQEAGFKRRLREETDALRAKKHQELAQERDKQEAFFKQRLREDTDALRAEKNAALDRATVSATAKAEEEHLWKNEMMHRLQKQLEESRAESESHKNASQTAEDKLRLHRVAEKDDREKNRRLRKEKKELSEELSKQDRSWSWAMEELRVYAERVMVDRNEMRDAKEDAEAETSSLRTANLALAEEKKNLAAKTGRGPRPIATPAAQPVASGSSGAQPAFVAGTAPLQPTDSNGKCDYSFRIAPPPLARFSMVQPKVKLEPTYVDLNRQQTQSNHLTAEPDGFRRQLAKSEATIKKEAEEKARRMAALEAEEGGREMDAPFGVSENANKGILRPQVPRWKRFLFG